MQNKTKAAAISLVLALAGMATQAVAGPVLSLDPVGGFQNLGVKEGRFTDIFQFHVDGSSSWGGSLLTPASAALDIDSAFLVKLGANGLPDLSSKLLFSELTAVNWEEQDVGSEQWALSSVLLSSGDWQLHVAGEGLSKRFGSYSGSLRTAAVPEPQTLALSLLAIAAMAGVARKRKAGAAKA